MTNHATFGDEIFTTVRAATRILYPEACIPETAMPSETKFTPGPWRVEPPDYNGRGLASIIEPSISEIVTTISGKGDAFLTAAAPELYEALAAIVNSTDYGADDERPLMRDARAVLAKARGEP